ncbi:MAG: Clp1/GlmU family protein [Armatimonadota bacterium]
MYDNIPEWEDTIQKIINDPGVVMVIGESDCGKTSFCFQACKTAIENGLRVALVDADVGQSEIGAPCTIGMAFIDDIEKLEHRIKPDRIHFVGNTSPIGHMMECIIGTKTMVDSALSKGAELVMVDTTGLVSGFAGLKLKQCKVNLVRPKHLIGIQKRKEIERLLYPFLKVNWVKLHAVKSSPLIRTKPPEFRATRRQSNYHYHFSDSNGHIIYLDEVSTWNTWYRTGRPLKWQYMKFLETQLNCKVIHSEVSGRGIYVVTENECIVENMSLIENEFKTDQIKIVPSNYFNNLIIGLADENANTINVGLVQAVDFKQKFLYLLSPTKTISYVKVLQFGSIKVSKDGQELGRIRPGDI